MHVLTIIEYILFGYMITISGRAVFDVLPSKQIHLV